MSYRNGFSLIELLVAMAIMSMTIMIASLGYSFYMQRWQQNLGDFNESANNAKKMMLIKQVFTGISPYILRDERGQSAIYFEGNTDGIIAVTTKSIFQSRTPFVMRLSVVQNADLSYKLIYEDADIGNLPITSITQNIDFSSNITLLNDLTDIEFSFYGAKDFTSYIDNGELAWWTSFNALNRKILPHSVRISFIADQQTETMTFPLSQVDSRILALFDAY